jgi:hypothetical protein
LFALAFRERREELVAGVVERLGAAALPCPPLWSELYRVGTAVIGIALAAGEAGLLERVDHRDHGRPVDPELLADRLLGELAGAGEERWKKALSRRRIVKAPSHAGARVARWTRRRSSTG